MSAGYWTLSLAGAAVLVFLLFGKSLSSSSAAKQRANLPTGETQAAGKSSSTWLAVLIMFIFGGCMVAVVVGLLQEGEARRNRVLASSYSRSAFAASPEQRYTVTVLPGTETAINVGLGMTCFTEPVEPNQKVWVRHEGSSEKILDWKGRPSGGNRRIPGSNYKYIQSAETYPVKVSVHIFPTPPGN